MGPSRRVTSEVCIHHNKWGEQHFAIQLSFPLLTSPRNPSLPVGPPVILGSFKQSSVANMSPSADPAKRPVRIAQIAASNVDRHEIFSMLAQTQEADVFCGDWMSEWNMCARGAGKAMGLEEFSYEETFVDAITPALPDLEKNGIKVAVNAGATDTAKLYELISGLVKEKGLGLKV